MLDASLAGTEVFAGFVTVEAGPVLRLGDALGRSPTRDEAGGLHAPPALLVSLVPFDALRQALGPTAPVLHLSEVQFEQRRPVRIGESLEVKSRLVDVVPRPGPMGRTALVVVDDEARVAGEVVFRARRVWAAPETEAA